MIESGAGMTLFVDLLFHHHYEGRSYWSYIDHFDASPIYAMGLSMPGKPLHPESGRLPPWLRKRRCSGSSAHRVRAALRGKALHTVCEQARCPNLQECFERGTATFLLMGPNCTRHCGFCDVAHGDPAPLDANEPRHVAEQVQEMGLKHAVITSVTRDDLSDGGAAHLAQTISAVRAACPKTTIEILTPDFQGRGGDIDALCAAQPDVFNHNLETVRRLTPTVRNRADYDCSLAVLSRAREQLPNAVIKSGLMVGLGETDEEIDEALRDLACAGCSCVTIGQYLQPSRKALAVARYIEPDHFREYEQMGLKHGLKFVFAGPFVRSSYLADEVMLEAHGR